MSNPRVLATCLAVCLSAACNDPSRVTVERPPLQIAIADRSIQGSFAPDGAVGAVVKFDAGALLLSEGAAISFDLDGIPLDVTIDLTAETLVEDGHGRSFEPKHRAWMLALRDAISSEHPEVMETLHGRVLVGVADRFAEAPIGSALVRSEVSLAQPTSFAPLVPVQGGCTGDGVSCLPGESGSSWAVFSIGGTCQASNVSYGDSVCRGRCGMGCNWFDNDYTWDCLDHDVCLDHSQSDCSDEFTEAADDWAATVAPLCWSGSTRSMPPPVPTPTQTPGPTPTPVPSCGDGIISAGEECDGGNAIGGDGCSATCQIEPTSVVIVPTSFTMNQRQRVPSRATATFPNGAITDVTSMAVWQTSNPAIAKLAPGVRGRIDAQDAAGSVQVSASIGAVAGVASVTVSASACKLTINEVQTAGATSADEWVELHNGCSQSVDVTGWTLVYRASTTVGASDTFLLASLTGTMEPGDFRLYSSANASSSIVGLASGTWGGGMYGQLKREMGAVGLRAGSLHTGSLIDSVAWGNVAAGHPFAEGGTTASSPLVGHSHARAPFDGRDSGVNGTDFVEHVPSAVTPKASNVH